METSIARTSTPGELVRAVDRAVAVLSGGDVVALPTETVYGLAADATRPEAVTKIFEAKERPFFDPLIVHLPEQTWLGKIAQQDDVFVLVEDLTQAFWPGPLTLVLPRWSIVPDIVTSGLETVAVRMSAHPVFREVVRAFGKPVAAPSANRFGRISPTSADDVMKELGGRIPLIIDGGVTTHGIESTIVKVEQDRLIILRAGPITREDLEAFAPVEVGYPTSTVEAPGQMKSHYAPRTPMILEQRPFGVRADDAPEGFELANISFKAERGEGERKIGVLAWKQPSFSIECAAMEVLSQSGDLREAAATLFAKIRRLDEAGLDFIVAEPVPEVGLGVAIMDRLRKAASVRG
jgi:L-threonylcarbamoyladenylate synthase